MIEINPFTKIFRCALLMLALIGAIAHAQSCEQHIENLDRLIKNQYVRRDWTNFWSCQILLSMELRKDAKLTQHQIAQLHETRRLAVRLKNDHQNILCVEAIAKSLRQTHI